MRDRGGMNSDWRGILHLAKLERETRAELETKIGNLQASIMWLAEIVGQLRPAKVKKVKR